MSTDNLGDRMKAYEDIPRSSLIPRVPVMLRLDGKAFSNLTGKHCSKPFDSVFSQTMQDVAIYLCQKVQGARIAYVQSDEISILITDWSSRDAQGWFDYQLQKMVSVAAGMASAVFTTNFRARFDFNDIAVFDARAWNVPAHEVCNMMIWRQQDATRNSINCLAQANFPHKKLHGLNTDQVQELLFQEKQINWNDRPTEQKRGVCIVKKTEPFEAVNPKTGEKVTTERSKWIVDKDIPIFTKDRNYIDQYLEVPDSEPT